jgi:hypothetical protein
VAADVFDEQAMGDADAHQEATAGLLGQGVLRRLHRDGIPRIDVRDARRDDERLRMVEQARASTNGSRPPASGSQRAE